MEPRLKRFAETNVGIEQLKAQFELAEDTGLSVEEIMELKEGNK